MKGYSTGLLLFAYCIRHAKALKAANGRGLFRINGSANDAKDNNADTVSKTRRRESSRELFEENNQA
jgi:hypothetical protein